MKMKKIIGAVLSVVLLACCFTVPAAAETDLTKYAIANGTVQAASYEDVTAPCSGTLLSFDLDHGDTVEAGTPLFELMTAEVRAPEDGTVGWLFAEAGDSADTVMATYGAVMAIQPAVSQRMHCTYKDAANYEANKHLHVGDKLYFKSGDEKGSGRVILVSGGNYEVEILSGRFKKDKLLDLFKDARCGKNDRVGKGKVYYRDDITVAASGRIAEILVAPGDSVKKGDVLLRTLSADAGTDVVPVISAPSGGVIDLISVNPGQQIWKGQLLCRIWHAGDPEIVAQVDEMDLGDLRVGDRVPVTLDTDESRIMYGTVTEISALGVTRQNAAYYSVHVSIDDSSVMLGQSASVYLPK